ncbi:MAG TPA: retropepsin-like aspartic protease [Candidatus Binatia bacterium]|nr:retropepsin-like aspartic protease [Candidatus Binatia bacterium]
MPRVVFDPAVASIVVDLLLEAADDRSSLVIPVVLDTGASMTIISTDIMERLGYDPANPALNRQRMVTGSGIEYAPRTSACSATAIGQRMVNLDVLCHDLPPESGVDGLLGLNFLRNFKLTIRFRKGIIDLNRER